MENKKLNQEILLEKTKSKEKKLRKISGILFLASIAIGLISRRKEIGHCLSRIYTPDCSTTIYYIWELVGLAILLFITALNLLLSSFKISKLKLKISSLILFIVSGAFYYFAEREKPCMECRVAYFGNQETIYGKLIAITILTFLSGLSLFIHSFRKEKNSLKPQQLLKAANPVRKRD